MSISLLFGGLAVTVIVLSMLDHTLDTKKKRHIAGGILMSISLLFGGLAVTVMTLKSEEKNDETLYLE